MSVTLRRISVLIAVVFSLAILVSTVNFIRFSPEAWLAERIGDNVLKEISGEVSSNNFGTSIDWTDIEFSDNEYSFAADHLSMTFNLLSVAIGKPNLQAVALSSPYLEVSNTQLSVQQLRKPIRFGFQNLNVTDGVFVSGETEVDDIEMTWLKNGVFGEYAAQISANLKHNDIDAQFGFSTLLGIDGEDALVMGKNQFDSQIKTLEWEGRLAGKIKSLHIKPNNDLQVKFANWSSSWNATQATFSFPIDWAGGLTSATLAGDTWSFNTLDSAIAYIDEQNGKHTFAMQSNATDLVGQNLIGQLGLSLLTEYPEGNVLQSYNLVMSGTMAPDKTIFEWVDPDIRISTIDAEDVQETHYLKVRELSLDPAQQSWHLEDGDWSLVRADLPAGDFGFGAIQGEWPSMTMKTAPNVASQLQPALLLIAPEMEFLNALFSQLVP